MNVFKKINTNFAISNQLNLKKMNEIWKEIEGYNGDYLISNLGDVCSNKFNKRKRLKPYMINCGYYQVGLSNNNIKKTLCIHRLVGKAFIPNPENKPEINHKNGIKTDNHISNLEWVTPKQNAQHAWQTGLKENARKAVKKNAIIASESRKVPIYSLKLDMQFESTVEAANYIQTYYFEDIKLMTIQSSICLLLNNKVTKSKYDFGWQIKD